MQRFKDLREKLIVESEYSMFGYQGQSLHQDDGVHQNLANKDKLGKVNAFIENFLSGEYMNPKARLEQLKIRLNQVGLNFNCNEGVSDGDITSYEVKYYGEVYGYKLDDKFGPTGEIGEQDLATEKFGSPLVLSVRSSGEGNISLEGKLHFVNETSEEDELVGEALELKLKIDNDDELFESKIKPLIQDVVTRVDGDLTYPSRAMTEAQAFKGFAYVVKSAAKKYEMQLDESDIDTVTSYLLQETLESIIDD